MRRMVPWEPFARRESWSTPTLPPSGGAARGGPITTMTPSNQERPKTPGVDRYRKPYNLPGLEYSCVKRLASTGEN
ncbi:hypothetical protein JZ751_016404 [Albula glossodonta]|uniref:Uncharacterized protein n=1 Tax=Albula glossodonta TaxID=121402 RepID=A0A8T2NY55_9TELE|nr:hypothetical protein JZ751_016404 [Albula glossodonta]